MNEGPLAKRRLPCQNADRTQTTSGDYEYSCFLRGYEPSIIASGPRSGHGPSSNPVDHISVYHEPARVELDLRFELVRLMSQWNRA